jgi:hypothetical protein
LPVSAIMAMYFSKRNSSKSDMLCDLRGNQGRES